MSKRDDGAPFAGRMKEPAEGDPSMRRLRRRYDQLREDYEELLDRLADLEERIAERDAAVMSSQSLEQSLSLPIDAPGGVLAELIPHLVAPLARLREEYEATLGGLQTIVEGLNSLAAGAMKGQRGGGAVATAEPGLAPGRETGRPRQLQVEVKGKGFGELLDFQERITSIEGVARVSIHGIDSERATFIVELTN